jgi:hypothetical protein
VSDADVCDCGGIPSVCRGFHRHESN